MSTQKSESPVGSPQDDFLRWTSLNERTKAIANYADILKQADLQSVTQVENFTEQIQKIYKGTLAVYIVTLSAVGIVFIISIIFLFTQTSDNFQKIVGTIGLPVCLIILLLLVYRTPLKSARQIVGEIIRMQVIYLGYLRQVNQIDIGFKQSFLSVEKLSPKQMQETFAQTQQIIDKAMDDINLLLEDLS